MKKYVIYVSVAAFLIIMPFVAFGQETNTNTDDSLLTTGLTSDTNVTSTLNTNEPIDSVEVDPVLAEEISEITEDPGTVPGDTFYFLKSWGEGIRLFFTFDEDKKIELQYLYTLRRYAEADKLLEEGNTERAQLQIEKAEQKMERIRERIQEMTQDGTGDKTAVIERLEAIQERHQDMMMDMYDKLPEQAQESMLRALDNSSDGLENAIESVKGSEAAEKFTERVETRIENSGDEVKLEVQNRIRAMHGEEEAEEEESTEPSDGTNTNSDITNSTNTTDTEDEDSGTDSSENDNSGRGSDSSTNSSEESESESD